jgi:2-dehydro-3-deoxy-D-arabinonate dehydratase
MKLAKYRTTSNAEEIGQVEEETLQPLRRDDGQPVELSWLLERDDRLPLARSLVDDTATIALDQVTLLPPLDQHEVWAAGVTYKRSRTARMEESDAAASCYDRVYESPRPELFFKATRHRVSGHGQPLRIRADSDWNVPEPELALVLNPRLELAAFTVGNDMSSRAIEGENPLYLPQAKVYNQCCGLGPWLTLAEAMPDESEIGIRLSILRQGQRVFSGETSVDQMARSFEDLISWLGRENSFPHGVILLTGTGIVPESGFTLRPGDVVQIHIDGIGTLTNPVIRG